MKMERSEEAARWVVALEDEAAPAETREEFARWCAADAGNAEAFRRAKAMRDALVGLARRSEDTGVARLRAEVRAQGDARSRRPAKVISFGIGLAAAAAVLFVFSGPSQEGRGAAVASVAKVESYVAAEAARLVALPDGSTVELNAGARLEVAFGPSERRVRLRTGEAHFSVAKDAARPFVVAAGEVAVRAVGTAFNVRIGAGAVEVLVTEGRVAVGQTEAAPKANAPRTAMERRAIVEALDAGQRVVVATGGVAAAARIEAVEAAEIERALAWQTSLLVFSETPLAEAVEQFNRRNRVQIVLGDRELAGQRVGGKIRVDSPETFVRVLESGGAIVADRSDAERIVLRKAR